MQNCVVSAFFSFLYRQIQRNLELHGPKFLETRSICKALLYYLKPLNQNFQLLRQSRASDKLISSLKMANLLSETIPRFTAETLRSAAKQSEGCHIVPVRLRRAIKKYLRGVCISV